MDSFERSFKAAQAAYDRMEPPEYWADDIDDEGCEDELETEEGDDDER